MASNIDQLTAMQNSVEPAQEQPPELDLRSAILKGIKAGLQRRAEARAEQERMMLAKATAATAPLQGQPQQPPMPQQGPGPQQPAQPPMPQQQQPGMPPAFPPGQYPQVPQPQPGWQAPTWPPPYTMMPPGPGPGQ